jgi:DNA-binding HxlR family transcriptional regulator
MAAPPYPGPPAVTWQNCPIATSLGSLGRRWTLTILRDIAFFPKASFGLILKGNKGLGSRTLSLRLGQLAREGLVRKVAPDPDPRHPHHQKDRVRNLGSGTTKPAQLAMPRTRRPSRARGGR